MRNVLVGVLLGQALKAMADDLPEIKPTDVKLQAEIKYELVLATDGSFWQNYRYYFTNRLNLAVDQEFRPMRYLEWRWKVGLSPTKFSDKFGEAMMDSIREGLEYGGEEIIFNTSLGMMPEDIGDRLLELVLGHTDERYISFNAPKSVVERWWQHADTFDYGVRPFQLDPYAFFTFAPKDTVGIELFKLHTRAYIKNFNYCTVESFLFVDVAEGWQFGAWHTYVTRLGKRIEEHSVTIALRKEFRPGTEFVARVGDHTEGNLGVFVAFASWW